MEALVSVQLDEARALKNQGNAEFKEERYDQALKIFEKAIKLTPPEEKNDIAILHNNRGIAYQKMVSFGFTKNQQTLNKEAKAEFSKAIELKPDYVKPRGLRMKILKDEEEYEQALEDAKKIEELEPLYPGIHKQVIELEKLHKEKFEKMKTEVLGNLKGLGNMFLGKFGMSLDNFKMNQNQDGTYNISY